MQRPTAKCEAELRQSYAREEARRVKNTIRRPTECTNLSLLGLTETQPPTKEHTRAVHSAPYAYVADVQLGLHEGPLTFGTGLSLTLLPAVGSLSPG